MRSRRARRRVAEPSTSASDLSSPPELPSPRSFLASPPSRIPISSRRIPTRSISMQANASSAESTSSVASRFRPQPAISLDMIDNDRLVTRRRRRQLYDSPELSYDDLSAIQLSSLRNRSPSNDIHRVARSRTFSDLLDNPSGPSTRLRGNREVVEYVDLTNETAHLSGEESSSESEASEVALSFSSIEPPFSTESSLAMGDEEPPSSEPSPASPSEHEE